MTTEVTIERISEILNESGAHQQLERMFSYKEYGGTVGLTPLECEELAIDIEIKIHEMYMAKVLGIPSEYGTDLY